MFPSAMAVIAPRTVPRTRVRLAISALQTILKKDMRNSVFLIRVCAIALLSKREPPVHVLSPMNLGSVLVLKPVMPSLDGPVVLPRNPRKRPVMGKMTIAMV